MLPFLNPPPALIAQAAASIRLAERYSVSEVLTDPARCQAFLRDYVAGEAPFFKICRNPDSGLIYDGYELDPTTGRPLKPRIYSAPSKECLDVALLVKILQRDPLALSLTGAASPGEGVAMAMRILERKLATYRQFEQDYPGYAGFLPWFDNSGPRPKPTHDWGENIPGLDNGEWLWALLLVPDALEEAGYPDLALEYRAYNQHLQAGVVKVFYDANTGLVRGDPHIDNPKDRHTGYTTDPKRATWLNGEHGVHEGIMLVMYVTLFGKGLPQDAPQRIWSGTRMMRLEHPIATTWEGWYGSAHEEWAYLFLPYRHIPEFARLFEYRQIIRTRNAEQRGYPGLHASALEPGGPGYLDGAGIEGVTRQKLRNQQMFALYGAFPVLLECSRRQGPNYGAAWLLNMLGGPRMQGPLGGGESGTMDGRKASASKTVDGTFTNLLAVMGGLEDTTARMLKREGRYQEFSKLLRSEYKEGFGSVPLERSQDWAAPTHPVPRGLLPDYK